MNKITVKQGEKAFKFHQDILSLKRQMSVAFLTMGKLLKEFRDGEHYKTLSYDTFISYVENSELGFKHRTAYYYIEIYEWFIDRLGYASERLVEIGYDKLIRLLPVVKRACKTLPMPKLKDRVENLVDDIQELRPVDFNKKYKDEQRNEEFKDYLAPPEYFRCDCHKKWRLIVPIEDCCPKFLEEFYKLIKKRYNFA
jgi:hypothetical protein